MVHKILTECSSKDFETIAALLERMAKSYRDMAASLVNKPEFRVPSLPLGVGGLADMCSFLGYAVAEFKKTDLIDAITKVTGDHGATESLVRKEHENAKKRADDAKRRAARLADSDEEVKAKAKAKRARKNAKKPENEKPAK